MGCRWEDVVEGKSGAGGVGVAATLWGAGFAQVGAFRCQGPWESSSASGWWRRLVSVKYRGSFVQ